MMRIAHTLNAQKYALKLPHFRIEVAPCGELYELRFVQLVRETKDGDTTDSHVTTKIATLTAFLMTSIEHSIPEIENCRTVNDHVQIQLYVPAHARIYVLEHIAVDLHAATS